jgi:2-succinyl-6-hydroxy-2,4-cyclohexadiene-1-carboxylate synthase
MFCEILRNGSGIPIVFLHGFLGSGQDWRATASHLKGRNCLAYDLPGHGKTPWTDMKIEELLARSLPAEPIDLVGYSLGGRLGLRFALCHPTRIHSLTLLSTNYGFSSDEEKQSRFKTDQMWAQKILSLPWDEFLFQWYEQPIFSSIRKKPDLLKEMLSARKMQRPQDLVKALLTWSLGHQECYRDQLLTYAPPWQVIYGKKDEKFAKLYADWPKAHCIAGAGHTLHFESAEEIARHLFEYRLR